MGEDVADLLPCVDRAVEATAVGESRSYLPKGGGYGGACGVGTTAGPRKGLKKTGAQCSVVTFCCPCTAFSGTTARGGFPVAFVVVGVMVAVGSVGSVVAGGFGM